MTWKIQALTGDAAGQEISIAQDMLVGRHQEADLMLQSGEVSRKHAALLLKDQELWVQDLNSSNGTYVNDLRINQEVSLKDGDTLQFASIKFSVLHAVEDLIDPVEPELPLSGVEEEAEAPKSAAQQMNDQGMPDLKERDAGVQLSRDGMPQNISVPKPAPIPEGVDIHAVSEQPAQVEVEQVESRVEQEKEQQKNASVGLMTIVALIILAIIAWLLFK